MIWNQQTVPTRVDERHALSLLIGKAFAQSYKISNGSKVEETEQLLELYRESRRMVDRETFGSERYGAFDAYLATQG